MESVRDLTLDQLVIRQARYKSQLDSFVKHIDSFAVINATEAHVEAIFSKLERIVENSKRFDAIQSMIEDEGDEVDKQLLFRVNCEDILDRSIGKAKAIINSFRNKQMAIVNQQTRVSTSNSNIKLPTISMPTFEGDFSKWKSFEDSFEALIHNNNELSDVQKLCYLKSSLGGEALSLIQALDTTSSNYTVAFDIIQNRYNHIRKITYSHAEAIIDLKFTSLRVFCNSIEQNIQCLRSLKLPVNSWDGLLVPLILSKLDLKTRRDWEAHLNNVLTKSQLPDHESLMKFLLERADIVEMQKEHTKVLPKASSNHSKFNQTRAFAVTSTTKTICQVCKGNHFIQNCQEFLKREIPERIKLVKDLRFCINCLRPGHFVKECSGSTCKQCHMSHNTLLHLPDKSRTNCQGGLEGSSLVSHCSIHSETNLQSLLPTANIYVRAGNGIKHKARAFLDSGSQSNFITEEFFLKLGIKGHKSKTSILGITQDTKQVATCATIKISSTINKFALSRSFLVLPRITPWLPQIGFSLRDAKFGIPVSKLADKGFNVPSPIDVLLGSAVFFRLLGSGQVPIEFDGSPTELFLQNTKLGWVANGELFGLQNKKQKHSYLSLNQNLERFWMVEDFSCPGKRISEEEHFCERHFIDTTTRDSKTGRFIVKFPLKNVDSSVSFGDSREMATKRFFSLERRLNKDLNTKQKYSAFIHEYAELGHMEEINAEQQSFEYFLPHHHVVKEDSSTTKLRVVFDGSAKTLSGASLNDIQAVGPTVQSDLFSILIRFRKHQFVAIADIEKMYRQVLIHPSHRSLQKIIWRDDPKDQIRTYQLNTVTYGTASAPYLATRCLQQLGIDHEITFPAESQAIKNDFYIDDLLTGADSIESLKSICKNIKRILSGAGFNLRKWKSNSDHFFNESASSSLEAYEMDHNITKTLGIIYESMSDTFQYSFEALPNSVKYTKREILSKTAQIFDPLGLLAPITIVPRLVIQELWREEFSWDEVIPEKMRDRWDSYRSNLASISEIKTPRHIILPDAKRVELHGFSDASEVAYGACVYVKSVGFDNVPHIVLTTAKSRVAPLKSLTLPRLELCAAVVLAQLVSRVKDILNIQFDAEFCWSDSKIVLAWINGSPHRWPTFVANRTAEIQRLSDIKNWCHVKSEFNPADLISRGLKPQDLNNCTLWWRGPDFLKYDTPVTRIDLDNVEVPEQKIIANLSVESPQNDLFSLFDRFSRLPRLVRVFSYCLRFIARCRDKCIDKGSRNVTYSEQRHALNRLVALAQQQRYYQEVRSLTDGKQLPKTSKLLKLAPYLDSNKLLRVGGRIRHAMLSYNEIHPVILPQNHPLTQLIAQNDHILNLHCGPNQLLFLLRQKYWPIAGHALTRKIVHDCLICFRSNPKPCMQFMGDLPNVRVTPSPSFAHCGIDFAGPFNSRDKRSRGYKTYKVYLCLFICMASRAIHLELVTSLSTDAFLAALRRFVARRGKPSVIYTDNGTNFVGANNELKQLYAMVRNGTTGFDELLNANDLQVEWKFIPPRSPHHGGIWESHIKIVKRHLSKVIGQNILTFEEFYTILTQIEAVVNSRPISPLSNNPNDFTPLTPAHFLIGRSLLTLPDDNITDVPENRLSVYQRMQHTTQHFWKRWQREYVQSLQTRNKWQHQGKESIQEGTLVLLVEQNSPPGQWSLGRIVKLWPGQDNVVRVVTVKTKTGEFKRSVTKMCILPLQTDVEEL